MTDRLLALLAALSRRERWLLALLAGAALPLAAIFGLVLPLAAERAAARQELAEAVVLREWVGAQHAAHAARLAAPDPTGAVPASSLPVGISGIEGSLREAGLRGDVARLTEAGDGTVTLGFEEVSFLALAEWLDEARLDGGYRIAAFTLERGRAPDLVAADLVLEPRQ